MVSVVIPAYNDERYVAEAIASVLGQTWRELECIVVDDGSTDSTSEIVAAIQDSRLKYLYKDNEGTVSAARNQGISAARGSFIAFLDADDVWLEDKLERQMQVLLRHPDVGLVYCGYAITDASLHPQMLLTPDPAGADLLGMLLLEANGLGCGSTAVVRKSLLDSHGAFRTELSVSADVDFVTRLAAHAPIAPVGGCLVLYRSHPGQIHRDLDVFEHDNLWILQDRFGGSRETRHLLLRGQSNLYTRLAIYHARQRRLSRAVSDLMRVLRARPARLVLLPTAALARRVRRRRNTRAELDELASRVQIRYSYPTSQA